MSILLKNGKVLLGEDHKLKKKDIFIKDNRIDEISENIMRSADSVISCEDRLIIPGFVNSHNHASMAVFRGFGDGLDLDDWLGKIYPIEQSLSREEIKTAAFLAMIEMIKSGITTFADMYFKEDAVAEAVSDIGMRAILAPGISDRGENSDSEINRANEVLKSIKSLNNDRINFMYGPHTTYTCSKKFLERINDLSIDNNVKIHIHVAETESGIEKTKDRHGMGPIKLLDEIGILSDRLVAVHGVWLDNEAIDLLKGSGANFVYNPSSNAKLKSGIAPIEKISQKVNVALGTDGAASNDSMDMFEEMKIGALIQRSQGRNLKAEKLFKMATINGSNAFGIDSGVIKEGFLADLSIINLDDPNLSPLNDPIVNLVFSGHGSNVESVIIDGELVMLDGEIIGIDRAKIVEKVNKIAEDKL